MESLKYLNFFLFLPLLLISLKSNKTSKLDFFFLNSSFVGSMSPSKRIWDRRWEWKRNRFFKMGQGALSAPISLIKFASKAGRIEISSCYSVGLYLIIVNLPRALTMPQA